MFRIAAIIIGIFSFVVVAAGQSDRGAVTGTITDSSSAVVPAANIKIRNMETNAEYETVTTPTGNYTLPQLPAGVYELSASAPGFSSAVQQGIRVQVAQTLRIDIVLKVGATEESVVVTADAPMLKTESAEQSYNLSGQRMADLPLEFGTRVRNPYTFANLVPGVNIVTSTSGTNDYRSDIRINGAPGGTFGVRVDGQNSDDSGNQATGERTLPGVDAIQEVSVQTSNYAPEFGQVVGGLFNFTTKSGTGEYHGSAYDYMTNEALNAGVPFTTNAKGGHTRPRNRKQNFGFSLGGPVRLPKLQSESGTTFFFVNYERFYQRATFAGPFSTVPTEAYRNGDFSAALTGRVLGTDPLGRPILENTIYDPNTSRVAPNGQIVRDPFPGNIIPPNRIDPVAAAIQSLTPKATRSGVVNNFAVVYPDDRDFDTTNIKIDHNMGSKTHLSFFYTKYRYDSFSHVVGDGLPDPISSRRAGHQRSDTIRITDDYVATPTLGIHGAIGIVRVYAPDSSPDVVLNYDTKQLGLSGAAGTGFPTISGLIGAQGGMTNLGIGTASLRWQTKPTAVASATWVHGNHTYKTGVEYRKDIGASLNVEGRPGAFAFSTAESGLPSTQGQNLSGGSVGFAYASFLLGAVNSARVVQPSSPQLRKVSWGLFVQDTWKMTRKITLVYGLRWDYQTAPSLDHDRLSGFSPTTPNPAAGGLLGATVYEGFGPGRCNCKFSSTYPYALGPRLGIAYQVSPKTVFRAGWGFVYGSTRNLGQGVGQTQGVGWNTVNFTTSAFGDPALLLRNGLNYNPSDLTAITYSPGIRPSPGQLDSPSPLVDANQGRPPRVNQWNIGLQREITKDLVVEAAYVGNRGVWLQSSGLINLNAITQQQFAAFGLDINSAADRTLLTSRLDSTTAINRGFGRLPYAGYPTSATVAQSLRPFPQFGTLAVQGAPLGNNWYDALQAKVTQRRTAGLEASAAFTWQKQLARGVETGVNNVFDRSTLKYLSSQSQPLVLQIAFSYQTPALKTNRLTRLLSEGWTISGIHRYASGLPILVPVAQNNLASIVFQSTYANRVPGQPLYLVDPNCHCIDPNKQFVLNPKAWSDPPAGQFGTSAAYYNDYRWQRQADEQLDIGRRFRVREKMSLSLRVMFFNALNRTKLNAPTSTNALATQSVNATTGATVSGFGFVNSGSLFGQPRTGQFLARFEF